MKYNSFRINPNPTPNYPDKVQVKGKGMVKSFVNEKRAKSWIDAWNAENMIQRQSKRINGELLSIGLLEVI